MTREQYNQSVTDHSDAVYRFLLKNTKNEDSAKDLVQETYEKLWRNKQNVDYSKSKSYIFTTAYHSFIDFVRKNKRLTDIEAQKTDHYSTEEQYSDLHEILNFAIDKLPEVQKSVILLRDYEGYSYREIAEITNLTEAQVKVYIYRGRKFLQQYIGKMEAVI